MQIEADLKQKQPVQHIPVTVSAYVVWDETESKAES